MASVDAINDYQKTTPLAVSRGLRVLGTHVSNWRKLQRLTAAHTLNSL